MLRQSPAPLHTEYDVAMLDLDGVVYAGSASVPHAPEAIAAAREAGLRIAFITNNASRTPDRVSDHLTRLGIAATPSDVVTSAQAAARLLADRFAEGSPILMTGGEGLDVALREVGLRPVAGLDDEPVAVATGYGPDLPWNRILLGAIAIADGLPWVATNTDSTIPTDWGLGPGHGALVDLLERFSGREAEVAGKPARPLLDETRRRMEATAPIMVGDRLDTDIAGAVNSEVDSLLVMTGVTTVAEIAAAAPEERPTYIAADLRGLLEPHPVPRWETTGAVLGGWRAEVIAGTLTVQDESGGTGTTSDWWRVTATALWRYRDETDLVADTGNVTPPLPG